MKLARKDLKKLSPYLFEIPKTFKKEMNVPARLYASERLLGKIFQDKSLQQLVNSASLPGVYRYVLAMPDIHEGYGLCIGGVLPTLLPEGLISPGSVGYDIYCSVQLLISSLALSKVKEYLPRLAEALFKIVPSGVGRKGPLRLDERSYQRVLQEGARWAVEAGYAPKEDLFSCEHEGVMEGADPQYVSERAKKRGKDQLGTLGSGNHFLEIQKVEEIYWPEEAQRLGLFKDQLGVMIHSGSRGLGHQICTDYVNLCLSLLEKYHLRLPDLELAGVPFSSKEGQRYFKAMKAAANYALANHRILAYWVRKAFREVLEGKVKETSLRLVWHMGHNYAQVEEFVIEGEKKRLCLHRKGAAQSREGQLVLIPGSMGTASYLLLGRKRAEEEAFASVAHGAGRVLSRRAAKKRVWGKELVKELKGKGIVAKSHSLPGLAEEAPLAYKDIDEVVRVVERAGLAKKIVRLVPQVVIKG